MGKSLLSFNRRQELEADREYFEKQLSNPLVQDKPMARKNLHRVEHALETQAPPDLKGPELDKVVRRAKDLEEEIGPNMLSQAEMRQAPPGALGRHMRFEKRYKDKILEWKNCMRTIHRDSDDPDVANVERLRPVTSQGNLDNALIPGKMLDFPSERFQENYEHVEWHEQPVEAQAETAESKAKRAEIAALRVRLEELESAEAPENGPKMGLEED